MKTSDLQGAALDWAAAKCEGVPVRWDSKRKVFLIPGIPGVTWKPSDGWTQGGPIIEREGIDLLHVQRNPAVWEAEIRNEPVFRHHAEGYTPLIAAMRCYVTSKLGDEIDIPEELK
jgi:hypothetical protein